jgi:hypothetical protein
MNATIARSAVPMLRVLTLGAFSFAGEPQRPPVASAPSIEGTNRLISQQFPDGTMLGPPDVMGLWSDTKTHRNLNVIRKDATGKFSSFSLMSTYTLTGTEYRETVLFSIRTDQIVREDIVYGLSGETPSAPVTMDGGRIQFTLPFESRTLGFEGEKVTAAAANNANVDIWERVE